jgi:hypothetical protein
MANIEIPILSITKFGLPVSATPERNDENCFNEDLLGSIVAGPTIRATEIRRINCQHTPKSFVVHIVGASVEATPVIPSKPLIMTIHQISVGLSRSRELRDYHKYDGEM